MLIVKPQLFLRWEAKCLLWKRPIDDHCAIFLEAPFKFTVVQHDTSWHVRLPVKQHAYGVYPPYSPAAPSLGSRCLPCLFGLVERLVSVLIIERQTLLLNLTSGVKRWQGRICLCVTRSDMPEDCQQVSLISLASTISLCNLHQSAVHWCAAIRSGAVSCGLL